MTDAHCHVPSGLSGIREFLSFEPADLPEVATAGSSVGIHPWTVLAHLDDLSLLEESLALMEARLRKDEHLGVGEIGLDRLKVRDIPQAMHDLFNRQLKLAGELGRPVTLHGAKCWGQVVRAIASLPVAARPPFCLFHGFSRSDGLIPDIVRLNGYISIGKSVLNDHAVNYRELVKSVPLDRLLIETDRTAEGDSPCLREILLKVAEVRGISAAELEATIDANAECFRIAASTGRIVSPGAGFAIISSK